MTVVTKNLSDLDYPGRLVMIGKNRDGGIVIVYSVTGRSPASQARRITKKDNTLWVEPTDEKLLVSGNRELLVYPAVILSDGIAVSNGRHTPDIHSSLGSNRSPMEVLSVSLKKWNYEPDEPAFTPRIGGCVSPGGSAALAVIKRSSDGSAIRLYTEFQPVGGKGKWIATYSGENRDPLPSFEGEPVEIEIGENTAQEMAESDYESLKPRTDERDFRVSVACVCRKKPPYDRDEVFIINRKERV